MKTEKDKTIERWLKILDNLNNYYPNEMTRVAWDLVQYLLSSDLFDEKGRSILEMIKRVKKISSKQLWYLIYNIKKDLLMFKDNDGLYHNNKKIYNVELDWMFENIK